ncbi:unnamed protein product [Moneuplotes crassus]|uniref:Uncharacterized protein n=1 Tax=Euplotes crassus TaxID=5936 RepID=A0AAD1U4C9_EUPCR|nr:unnamed protein product [Moneuplotes crassus]
MLNRDGSEKKRFLPEITGNAKFVDRVKASKSQYALKNQIKNICARVPQQIKNPNFEKLIAENQFKSHSRNIYYSPSSSKFKDVLNAYIDQSGLSCDTPTSTILKKNNIIKNPSKLSQQIKKNLDNDLVKGTFFNHKRLSVPGKEHEWKKRVDLDLNGNHLHHSFTKLNSPDQTKKLKSFESSNYLQAKQTPIRHRQKPAPPISKGFSFEARNKREIDNKHIFKDFNKVKVQMTKLYDSLVNTKQKKQPQKIEETKEPQTEISDTSYSSFSNDFGDHKVKQSDTLCLPVKQAILDQEVYDKNVEAENMPVTKKKFEPTYKFKKIKVNDEKELYQKGIDYLATLNPQIKYEQISQRNKDIHMINRRKFFTQMKDKTIRNGIRKHDKKVLKEWDDKIHIFK